MLYVIKICLGHKRAWCETLNKRNSLICCYFIPSSLEVFGFSCFFFIKKVIIYRTSVLSSLICQNIGWETERSMSVENNGLNRLLSLSLSLSLSFSYFELSSLFGAGIFVRGNRGLMTMNYMPFKYIKANENCLASMVLHRRHTRSCFSLSLDYVL